MRWFVLWNVSYSGYKGHLSLCCNADIMRYIIRFWNNILSDFLRSHDFELSPFLVTSSGQHIFIGNYWQSIYSKIKREILTYIFFWLMWPGQRSAIKENSMKTSSMGTPDSLKVKHHIGIVVWSACVKIVCLCFSNVWHYVIKYVFRNGVRRLLWSPLRDSIRDNIWYMALAEDMGVLSASTIMLFIHQCKTYII